MALGLICQVSTARVPSIRSNIKPVLPWWYSSKAACLSIMVPQLAKFSSGMQVVSSMGDALSLICHTSTVLAASIRQAAGWLGHTSAHSASPAQLQQVCSLLSKLPCHVSKIAASGTIFLAIIPPSTGPLQSQAHGTVSESQVARRISLTRGPVTMWMHAEYPACTFHLDDVRWTENFHLLGGYVCKVTTLPLMLWSVLC